MTARGCSCRRRAARTAGLGLMSPRPVKTKTFACPVKFANRPGQTADACRAPYVLCPNANSVDPAACTRAGKYQNGFFIGNVLPTAKVAARPPAARRAAASMRFGRLWLCGYADQLLRLHVRHRLQLQRSLTCSGSKIGDTTNNDGASGVLCRQ